MICMCRFIEDYGVLCIFKVYVYDFFYINNLEKLLLVFIVRWYRLYIYVY